MKTKLFYLIVALFIGTAVNAQEWIDPFFDNYVVVNFDYYEIADFHVVAATCGFDGDGAVRIITAQNDTIIDYNMLMDYNSIVTIMENNLLLSGINNLQYIRLMEVGDTLLNNITFSHTGKIMGIQKSGSNVYFVTLGDTNFVSAISGNAILWTTELESDPTGDITINEDDGTIIVGTDDGDAEIDSGTGTIITPPTGIWEHTIDISISVYPNPVVDNLTIEGLDNPSWKVFNIIGSYIESGVGNHIDFNQFHTGTYFIIINDEVTKKIIKK